MMYMSTSVLPLSLDIRKEILSKYCSYMEIGNQFWEWGVIVVLNNGIEIELIYCSLDEFDKDLQAVVLEHQAQNSYTTCMWYNLTQQQDSLRSRWSLCCPPEKVQSSLSSWAEKEYHQQAIPASRPSYASFFKTNQKSSQTPRLTQHQSPQ